MAFPASHDALGSSYSYSRTDPQISHSFASCSKEKGLTSRIHRKACRNRPLRDWEKAGNRSRSRFRVRVEHVFGAQHNDMGGALVRSIGLVRATARIGLKNLAYNMRRLVGLQRLGMVG